MKTYEEMIKQGYPADWPIQCIKCGSYDCHKYADYIQCFECKERRKNG